MARTRHDHAEPIDLCDYLYDPPPHSGRPPSHDLAAWRVSDDWAEQVVVNPEEIDVFERWFDDIVDELFGSSNHR